MKKLYEGPEIQIHNYALHTCDILTASGEFPSEVVTNPDLHEGDDYFG